MSYALKRQFDIDTGFVMRFFEEHYRLVLKHLKTCTAELSTVSSAADGIPGDADSAAVERLQLILNDLYETLERQALIAAQKGGEFAVSYYKEAQYIMAALTDELFLNLPGFTGKQYWSENLLESRLYGTHEAGDLFFKKLDDFLEKRDAVRRDIAEVYLLALGVGFKGKFRGMPDQRQLDYYRRELYIFINHEEPRLYQGEDRLFPQAYSHTLVEGQAKRFQDVRFWTGAFASIFGILLLMSFVIWQNATADVEGMADEIIQNSAFKI